MKSYLSYLSLKALNPTTQPIPRASIEETTASTRPGPVVRLTERFGQSDGTDPPLVGGSHGRDGRDGTRDDADHGPFLGGEMMPFGDTVM